MEEDEEGRGRQAGIMMRIYEEKCALISGTTKPHGTVKESVRMYQMRKFRVNPSSNRVEVSQKRDLGHKILLRL